MIFRTSEPMPLFELLQAKLGSSRPRIKKMIAKREILLEGRPVKGNPRIEKGKTIEVRRRRFTENALPILFEDSALLAIRKPVGVRSSKSRVDSYGTALGQVNQYLRSSGGAAQVIHRIDQPASGVLLFAKTPAVAEFLKAQWSTFTKQYHVLVEGRPPIPEGELRNWVYEGEDQKVRVGKCPNSQEAFLTYRTVKNLPRNTLLEVTLGTGRKHQVRVQLAAMGCPVVGDSKYGAKKDPLRRLGLHAFRLKLTHPVSKRPLEIFAPTPKSFLTGIREAGFHRDQRQK